MFWETAINDIESELRSKIDVSQNHYTDRDRILADLAELKASHPEHLSVPELLDKAGSEARNTFYRTLAQEHSQNNNDSSHVGDSKQVYAAYCSFCSGFYKKLFQQESPTYCKTLEKVAKRYLPKGSLSKDATLYEKERIIVEHRFQELWTSLDEVKKEKLIAELQNNVPSSMRSSCGKELTVGAALGGAQLSGFGVYLAATSMLGAISSFVGITLPFVVYTTLTSAVSVVIGPVGWLALGAVVLGKIMAPNGDKVFASTLFIASLRVMESYDPDNQIRTKEQDLLANIEAINKSLKKIASLKFKLIQLRCLRIVSVAVLICLFTGCMFFLTYQLLTTP